MSISTWFGQVNSEEIGFDLIPVKLCRLCTKSVVEKVNTGIKFYLYLKITLLTIILLVY